MPKELTHWHIAEKAFQHLKSDSILKQLISTHKNSYLAGAVIMDTPFYLLHGKGSSAMFCLANQVHDTPSSSLSFTKRAISIFLPKIPNPVLAFLLGALSHVYADAAFHPMVYYFSGTGHGNDKKKNKTAQYRHHTLETYLDLYYLEKGLFLPQYFYVSRLFKQVEMNKAPLMAVLRQFFSIQNETELYFLKKAINMHMLLQRLFDWNLLKVGLFSANRLLGLNMDHLVSSFYPINKPKPKTTFLNPFKYQNPVNGEHYCQTIDAIAKNAHHEIIKSFDIIEHHFNKGTLPKAFDALIGPNLYSGLMGFQISDMRHFNTTIDVKNLIFGKTDSTL